MIRTLTSVSVAAVLLLIAATPILAHAELKSANPGPKDTVVGSPAVLVATFTQNLDPSRTSMSVLDAAGKELVKGGEPGDGKRAWRLDLPELSPGTYTVKYTTFSSEDKEVHRGSYTFTVTAAPSPSPEPSPSPSPTPEASRSPAPSASPVPSPSAAPSAAASAAASPIPTDGTGASDSTSTILVIVAAFVVVAVVAFALLRRRSA